MLRDVILILKNSFCKTACACMVMQIKLVVVVVVIQWYVYSPRPLRAPQYSTFACCLIPVLNLVVLLFLLDDTTILPFAGEEKTGDTHICAPVQRYVYPSCEHHNIPSLHVVWLLVVLLVVLDDIDDISFSKKIKVKNEGDTHIACVASVSSRRSYCAKVRAGAKKNGGKGRRRGEEETVYFIPLPLPRHSFFLALVPATFSTNSRGNACYPGYTHSSAPTHWYLYLLESANNLPPWHVVWKKKP